MKYQVITRMTKKHSRHIGAPAQRLVVFHTANYSTKLRISGRSMLRRVMLKPSYDAEIHTEVRATIDQALEGTASDCIIHVQDMKKADTDLRGFCAPGTSDLRPSREVATSVPPNTLDTPTPEK